MDARGYGQSRGPREGQVDDGQAHGTYCTAVRRRAGVPWGRLTCPSCAVVTIAGQITIHDNVTFSPDLRSITQWAATRWGATWASTILLYLGRRHFGTNQFPRKRKGWGKSNNQSSVRPSRGPYKQTDRSCIRAPRSVPSAPNRLRRPDPTRTSTAQERDLNTQVVWCT
jgi:hypothetical protein